MSDYIPSPYQPELPEYAKMVDASPAALGRRNTLVKRIPAMPGGEMGDLSYTNYAAEQAALQSQAIGIAAAERKFAEKRSKAISRAKDRQAQRIAEKRTRLR